MNRINRLIGSILLLLTGSASTADAAELTVTPNKCVALRKGQMCYQTLQFSFTAEHKGKYCLMASNVPEPLQCWKATSHEKFSYAYVSDTATEFSLVDPQRVVLATTEVSIAWVYKKSRLRSRWRLF